MWEEAQTIIRVLRADSDADIVMRLPCSYRSQTTTDVHLYTAIVTVTKCKMVVKRKPVVKNAQRKIRHLSFSGGRGKLLSAC